MPWTECLQGGSGLFQPGLFRIQPGADGMRQLCLQGAEPEPVIVQAVFRRARLKTVFQGLEPAGFLLQMLTTQQAEAQLQAVDDATLHEEMVTGVSELLRAQVQLLLAVVQDKFGLAFELAHAIAQGFANFTDVRRDQRGCSGRGGGTQVGDEIGDDIVGFMPDGADHR